MLKKSLILVAASLLSTSLFLTSKDVSAYQSSTVTNAEWLNMRETPSNSGKIVAVLQGGATVEVLNDSGSWDYVKYNGKTGYVSDKYLKANSSSNFKNAVVNTDYLNVRGNPNANGSLWDTLKKGTKVVVGNTYSNGWALIYYENGKYSGYVNGTYLTYNTVTPPTQPTTPPTTPPTTNYKNAVVNTDYLNVRANPNASASLWDTIGKGTKVVIGNTYSNGWALIYYGDGKYSGYVNGTYLSADNGSTTTPPTTPPTTTGSLKNKLIVLDPGHGHDRPGAIANGITEKFMNYDVASRTKTLLEQRGAKVVMTRNGDTDCAPYGSLNEDLNCRPGVANKLGADIFVSIHSNSGTSAANGAEAWYYKSSGKALATAIQNAYVNETGLRYRKVDSEEYAVLTHSNVPSTLLEMGFITNPEEASKMKTDAFKDKAALGIVKGIENYFGK